MKKQYIIRAPLPKKIKISFCGLLLWTKLIAPDVQLSNIENLIPSKRYLEDMTVSTQNSINYFWIMITISFFQLSIILLSNWLQNTLKIALLSDELKLHFFEHPCFPFYVIYQRWKQVVRWAFCKNS